MTKRKATAQTAEQQPTEQIAESAEVQNNGQPQIQEAEAPKRRRRQAEKAGPIELDPAFIHDSARMQYALLLALLLRQKGTSRFNARDMSYDEKDFNILFARTLDGQSLEVSVVSAESGIIRSPERQKEAEQWENKEASKWEEKTLTYQPLPPSSLSGDNPAVLFALQGMDQSSLMRTPPGAPVMPQIPSLPTQPTAEEVAAKALAAAGDVIRFPVDPTKPKDGTAAYHFPFQTGNRPEDARETNLDLMGQRLLNKDLQLQEEEAAAIRRMEEGS